MAQLEKRMLWTHLEFRFLLVTWKDACGRTLIFMWPETGSMEYKKEKDRIQDSRVILTAGGGGGERPWRWWSEFMADQAHGQWVLDWIEGSCIHSILAAEIQALCCLPAGGDRCWLVSHNQVWGVWISEFYGMLSRWVQSKVAGQGFCIKQTTGGWRQQEAGCWSLLKHDSWKWIH